MTHTREEMLACSREELLYLADQQAYARARYPEDDSGLIRESRVIEYALRLAALASDGVKKETPLAKQELPGADRSETELSALDRIARAWDLISSGRPSAASDLIPQYVAGNWAASFASGVSSDPVVQPHESGER